MFMIYDKIEKEDIWYDFFKDIDEDKYSILIHIKDQSINNLKYELFKKNVHIMSYPSEWGAYSLLNVQNRLLEEGMKNEKNYKFILLSGHDIPLHNFNFIYNFMIKDNLGYISYFNLSKKNIPLKERIKKINNIYKYNLDKWVYSMQWNIFNRNTAEFILNNEQKFINIFGNCQVPDEFAYINFLLEHRQYNNILNRKTTFVSGAPPKNLVKYRKYPHVFEYDELDDILLSQIKKSYLFIRKIVENCNINNNIIFENIPNFNLDDRYINVNYSSSIIRKLPTVSKRINQIKNSVINSKKQYISKNIQNTTKINKINKINRVPNIKRNNYIKSVRNIVYKPIIKKSNIFFRNKIMVKKL